jgi:hypothetical protein
LRSLTTATQVMSTSTTSSGFMEISPGGALWQAGTPAFYSGRNTPIKDIRGRKLPNNRGRYSIGACCAWDNQTFQPIQSR